jgi:hypothetical protein
MSKQNPPIWPSYAGRALVNGFTVPDDAGDTERPRRQKHLAIFEDGMVKITKNSYPIEMGNFNNNFEWEVIPKKPPGARYIGSYPANM